MKVCKTFKVKKKKRSKIECSKQAITTYMLRRFSAHLVAVMCAAGWIRYGLNGIYVRPTIRQQQSIPNSLTLSVGWMLGQRLNGGC